MTDDWQAGVDGLEAGWGHYCSLAVRSLQRAACGWWAASDLHGSEALTQDLKQLDP